MKCPKIGTIETNGKMALKPSRSLNPHGAPVQRAAILANDVTFTENDSVKIAGGFCALGTTGALVFGHIVSINTRDGVGVNTDGTAGAAMGSFAGSFLSATNNQTVAKVVAMCDISKFSLYSADPDAPIGTTTGSNLLGYRTDILDEDTTLEDSAQLTSAQYYIWGVDPNDAGNQMISILESGVLGV